MDFLEPKDTEEIRPGLFVQKRNDKYRVVKPIRWKGEWKLQNQFSLRNLFMVAIIVFVAWSYFHDTEFCRQLTEDPCKLLPNITSYCFEQDQLSYLGGDENKRENSFTIQDYP